MLNFFKFFKKKEKTFSCTLTPDDQAYVHNTIDWFKDNIIDPYRNPTICPTPKFWRYTFKQTEEDAHYLLKFMGESFGIDTTYVRLTFFDNQLHVGEGLITQKEDDKNNFGGLYTFHSSTDHEIAIDKGLFINTEALIATFVH